MNTIEVLKAARELIAIPERWLQGSYAVDANGDLVDYMSLRATRLCARGACKRMAGFGYAAEDLLNMVAREIDPGCGGCSDFNDTHTHAEVLALFDAAISKASANAA